METTGSHHCLQSEVSIGRKYKEIQAQTCILPFSCQIAAPFRYSHTKSKNDLLVEIDRHHHDGCSHCKLSKDNTRIEKAEKESPKFGPTGLSNPERRDGEHHPNCNACLSVSNAK